MHREQLAIGELELATERESLVKLEKKLMSKIEAIDQAASRGRKTTQLFPLFPSFATDGFFFTTTNSCSSSSQDSFAALSSRRNALHALDDLRSPARFARPLLHEQRLIVCILLQPRSCPILRQECCRFSSSRPIAAVLSHFRRRRVSTFPSSWSSCSSLSLSTQIHDTIRRSAERLRNHHWYALPSKLCSS